MRNIAFIISLLAVLLLSSCGEDGKHFKIEGHLLQMNQGEFYVYSMEGGLQGIDTIKVQGGRFAYEVPCEREEILSLVFPNFSEVPIFAEPGKTVKLNGDASHLKELEIKGTKTNELMSSFRAQIKNASPPETKQYAIQFTKDHPESPIGIWLVKKYIIATPSPDYKEANDLIKLMKAHQKDNGQLVNLSKSVSELNNASVGKRLPSFTAYDTKGGLVSSAQLSTGTAIIMTYATWSYNSSDILRQVKDKIDQSKANVKVVVISVDPSKTDCENYLKTSNYTWPVICTGEMFDTNILSQLGMKTVPDNIVVRNGTITARDLSASDLMNEIK